MVNMSYPSVGTSQRYHRTSLPNARLPNTTPVYAANDPAYQRKAADLARVRENQRRSRARKRDYISELESRLRQCEQLGVEATAEVTLGARKVTEENRQLRELLHAHGVDDRHIAHHVQKTTGAWEVAPGAIPPIADESPAQFLQKLLLPRRLSAPDLPAPLFTLPSQGNQDGSAYARRPSPVAAWEPSPPGGRTAHDSPPARAVTSRNAESYYAPILTTHSQGYPTLSDGTGSRDPRIDPLTPSRAFEESDQEHYSTPPSRADGDMGSGSMAPRDMYHDLAMREFTKNDDFWSSTVVSKDPSTGAG